MEQEPAPPASVCLLPGWAAVQASCTGPTALLLCSQQASGVGRNPQGDAGEAGSRRRPPATEVGTCRMEQVPTGKAGEERGPERAESASGSQKPGYTWSSGLQIPRAPELCWCSCRKAGTGPPQQLRGSREGLAHQEPSPATRAGHKRADLPCWPMSLPPSYWAHGCPSLSRGLPLALKGGLWL